MPTESGFSAKFRPRLVKLVGEENTLKLATAAMQDDALYAWINTLERNQDGSNEDWIADMMLWFSKDRNERKELFRKHVERFGMP